MGQAIIDLGYDDGKCNQKYVTAMFNGEVELVEGIENKRKVLNMIFENQERTKTWVTDSHLMRIQKDTEVAGVTIGRIVLQELTGKVSGDDLSW